MPSPVAKAPFVVGKLNICNVLTNSEINDVSLSRSLLNPPLVKITALPVISSKNAH